MGLNLGQVRKSLDAKAGKEAKRLTMLAKKRNRMKSKITPLEMRAIARALGVRRRDMAKACGVAETTWRGYLSGETNFMLAREDGLRSLAETRTQMFGKYVEALKNLAAGDEVAMVWYEEAEDYENAPGTTPEHWGIYCQVAGLLCAQDQRVRLVAFEPEDYQRWLRGRDDSESLRMMWAAQV